MLLKKESERQKLDLKYFCHSEKKKKNASDMLVRIFLFISYETQEDSIEQVVCGGLFNIQKTDK